MPDAHGFAHNKIACAFADFAFVDIMEEIIFLPDCGVSNDVERRVGRGFEDDGGDQTEI